MKRKPRIAIVEFSPVHDLSFAVIAKAVQALGGQLDIYAPNKLLDQTAILPGNVHRMRIGKGWGAGTVPAIVCRILAGGYDAVWVNTAHGPRARSLLASLKCLMPRRCLRLGVIHFTEKTIESWSTKLILDLLDGAVVFSQFLRQTMPQSLQAKTFAWYPMLPSSRPALTLDNQRIRLVIPGALDPNRRDYTAIVQALRDPELNPRIQFVLLGRCPRDQAATKVWLDQLPKEAVQEQRIRLWYDYVGDQEFTHELDQAHGICLIMHPTCPQYRMFCQHQASGATYLAYARGIPLLVENGMLPAVKEFGPHLISYEVSEFTQACNQLAKRLDTNPSRNKRSVPPPESTISHQAGNWLRIFSPLSRKNNSL